MLTKEGVIWASSVVVLNDYAMLFSSREFLQVTIELAMGHQNMMTLIKSFVAELDCWEDGICSFVGARKSFGMKPIFPSFLYNQFLFCSNVKGDD